MTKYEIEVWNKDNKPIGDIRRLCSNLSWSKALNDVEEVNFEINLNLFEDFLKKAGYKDDPYGFLDVGSHDIRIKRNGNYIIGCNVIKFSYSSEEAAIKMSVSCYGYLNYYKTRYITANYSKQLQEDILFDVIDKCNNTQGGDYGVRKGKLVGGGYVERDRNYERKEVKSLIQQMSEVIDGPDFDFSPDKKFNIYDIKGEFNPNIVIKYPGNVQSFSFDRSIDQVANAVTSLGSGNGQNVVKSYAQDIKSASEVYRREKITSYNSVTDQNTLNQHCLADLAMYRNIIELPSVTVNDGVIDLNSVDVGDVITVELSGCASLKHINGYYRIIGIDCAVDDNDAETTTLTFDNDNIEEIINKQEALKNVRKA